MYEYLEPFNLLLKQKSKHEGDKYIKVMKIFKYANMIGVSTLITGLSYMLSIRKINLESLAYLSIIIYGVVVLRNFIKSKINKQLLNFRFYRALETLCVMAICYRELLTSSEGNNIERNILEFLIKFIDKYPYFPEDYKRTVSDSIRQNLDVLFPRRQSRTVFEEDTSGFLRAFVYSNSTEMPHMNLNREIVQRRETLKLSQSESITDSITMETITDNFCFSFDETNEKVSLRTFTRLIQNGLHQTKNPFTNLLIRNYTIYIIERD
jgi:hypothetical protein